MLNVVWCICWLLETLLQNVVFQLHVTRDFCYFCAEFIYFDQRSDAISNESIRMEVENFCKHLRGDNVSNNAITVSLLVPSWLVAVLIIPKVGDSFHRSASSPISCAWCRSKLYTTLSVLLSHHLSTKSFHDSSPTPSQAGFWFKMNKWRHMSPLSLFRFIWTWKTMGTLPFQLFHSYGFRGKNIKLQPFKFRQTPIRSLTEPRRETTVLF